MLRGAVSPPLRPRGGVSPIAPPVARPCRSVFFSGGGEGVGKTILFGGRGTKLFFSRFSLFMEFLQQSFFNITLVLLLK